MVWATLKIARAFIIGGKVIGSDESDHLGGGAVEGGTGFPSAVLGSINSMRVPSGSNRFACRFPLIPIFISMGLL
jgi:hypothetical protein